MKRLNAYIEHRLDGAARRLKWLQFLQHSATLGILVALLILLCGVGSVLGWFEDRMLMQACVAFVVGGAVVVWFIMGLAVAASRPDDSYLGESMERACPSMLDRLNTLLFLGNKPSSPADISFYRRIERQALSVLSHETAMPAFSPIRTLLHWLAFVVVVLLTVWFFDQYSPFQQLQTTAPPPLVEESLEIPPTEPDPTRVVEPWGEVRITRPGRNIRVTRLEDVPLQIEAAANRAITRAAWFTSINGGREIQHDLPAPMDPNFAVYQPEIKISEFGLSDWDVMAYYATATTEDDVTYVSETYFIEILPLREELNQIPGGRQGASFAALDLLTAMIEQQKEVVQETHRQLRRPDQEPAKSDRNLETPDGLADAETELAGVAGHLSAMATGEFDDPGLDTPVAHLGFAQNALNRASGQYRNRNLNDAEPEAKRALAELIDARKQLHERMKQNPAAYDQPKLDDEELARRLAERLRQVSALADEAEQAREAVQKLAEQQRQLADRAESNTLRPSERTAMAGEEDAIRQALSDLQKQFPGVFSEVGEQTQSADQSVLQASDAFRRNDRIQSPQRADSATEQLEQLAQALEDQTLARQLAKAYQLKAMLDQQIKTMEGLEQQPGSMSQAQLEQQAAEIKQTTGELKELMEQGRVGEFFGQPLHDALNDENKAQLDKQADGVPPAPLSEPRQQAAGQCKAGLQAVSDAFEASQPSMMAGAGRGGGGQGGLTPGAMQSLGRAMSQLRALLGLQYGGTGQGQGIYRGPRIQLSQEALANLLDALSQLEREDALDAAMIQKLREMLKNREELDPGMIEMLLSKLDNITVEVVELRQDEKDDPDAVYIDPTKLPPAYRARIQKYFEMLSNED